MLIWRIENNEGKGAYAAFRWQLSDHCDIIHPSPEEDKLLSDFWKELESKKEERCWFFGFESEEQLKSWFCSKEIENLKELGFHVVKINAEIVFKGERQLIFKRNN